MKRIVLLLVLVALFLIGGCAQQIEDTEVRSIPPGADVTIQGMKVPYPTPFKYKFDFTTNQKYALVFNAEGFFEEEFVVEPSLPSLKKGEVVVNLTPSPLWAATSASPATNNWIQILVGPELDARKSWQIMIDAVVKRSSNIMELNYESGYLQTKYTVKKFDTRNGEFLLRCQLIANLVSSEPLIYRIKDVSEWSGNGVQWHPYNRILNEHAEMITEIQDRLGSY